MMRRPGGTLELYTPLGVCRPRVPPGCCLPGSGGWVGFLVWRRGALVGFRLVCVFCLSGGSMLFIAFSVASFGSLPVSPPWPLRLEWWGSRGGHMGLLFRSEAPVQLSHSSGGSLETWKSQEHIHHACCKILCSSMIRVMKVVLYLTWPMFQNRSSYILPPWFGSPGLPEMIECRLVVVEIFGRGLACFDAEARWHPRAVHPPGGLQA